MNISRPFALPMIVAIALASGHYGLTQQFASSSERKLFTAVNRERELQGLPPLHWDPALAAAARLHAREMAEHRSISHQFYGEPSLAARATKAGSRFTALAENVAQAPSAAEVHQLWMNSSPHRANILDPQMNAIGIAVAERDGEMFAVEDFSRAR